MYYRKKNILRNTRGNKFWVQGETALAGEVKCKLVGKTKCVTREVNRVKIEGKAWVTERG